jgi:hypothetical protein
MMTTRANRREQSDIDSCHLTLRGTVHYIADEVALLASLVSTSTTTSSGFVFFPTTELSSDMGNA